MLSFTLGGPCFPTDKMGICRILVGLVHRGIGLYARPPQSKRIRAGDEGLGSDGKSPLQPRMVENTKKVLSDTPLSRGR